MQLVLNIIQILALFLCVMFWFAARRIKVAHASTPPIGQILTVNGKDVHAVVMGNGPDLVIIHGSNGNVRDMTMSIAPKLAHRYRVILLDRPGHGYTPDIDPKGDSLKDQALLLRDAALMLGADKPIVMGHSFGGAIALAWAVHAPLNISGLLPLSACSNMWTTPLETYYRLASAPILGWPFATFVAAFGYEGKIAKNINAVFEPDAVPSGYRANFGVDLLLRPKSIRANALQRKNIRNQIKTLIPHYGDIAVPTEIVHGTNDTTVPMSVHAEKLVEQIPNAVLTPLEGKGHMPHHSATHAVIEAVDRLSRRVQANS